MLLCTQVSSTLQQCDNICSSLVGQGGTYTYLTLERQNISIPEDDLLRICDSTETILRNDTLLTTLPPNVTAINVCQSSLDEYYNGTVIRRVHVSSGALNISNDSCNHARSVCLADMYASGRLDSCNCSILSECVLNELGLFSSERLLEEKLNGLTSSLQSYSNLLDRTVRGVLIAEGKGPTCLGRYTNWLCRTKLPLLFTTGDGHLTRLKPCLEVCWDVIVECPFYLPAQYQHTIRDEDGPVQDQYAGTPVFSCPSLEWIDEFHMQSRYRMCASSPTAVKSYFLQNCL